MARCRRWIILAIALTLFSTGCISSLSVSTSNVTPTPVPTRAPVVIPTTAPPAAPTTTPTPFPLGHDTQFNPDGIQNDVSLAGTDREIPTTPTVTPTSGPTATATPIPTPTADVIAIPTTPPRPTQAPAPTAAPAPRVRPTSTPAPSSASGCPGGQILTTSGCACPGGQAKRAMDSQCVRLCNQSDLTINHSCVCTGELYDNGGQCVKRCLAHEVPDRFGGCKVPGTDG